MALAIDALKNGFQLSRQAAKQCLAELRLLTGKVPALTNVFRKVSVCHASKDCVCIAVQSCTITRSIRWTHVMPEPFIIVESTVVVLPRSHEAVCRHGCVVTSLTRLPRSPAYLTHPLTSLTSPDIIAQTLTCAQSCIDTWLVKNKPVQECVGTCCIELPVSCFRDLSCAL